GVALKYRLVLRKIETLTLRRVELMRVIGGGSGIRLLNQFTADATGGRVLAGAFEAAVLGNIGVQMMATGRASCLAEMRAIIDRSFPAEVFDPGETDKWDGVAERFQQYCELTYA